MAFSENYRRQVALLLRTIPYVAKEKCFALKGGTAINLFVRDMPRLSVDIDLTYVPVYNRSKSLGAIDKAMKRIAGKVEKGLKGSLGTSKSGRQCARSASRACKSVCVKCCMNSMSDPLGQSRRQQGNRLLVSLRPVAKRQCRCISRACKVLTKQKIAATQRANFQ
jgi:hypothetical protein